MKETSMQASPHPFDRYAPFTDVHALLASCKVPPRRSLRVNTLKSSVEKVTQWMKGHGWSLEPVAWCGEGFFALTPPTPLSARSDYGSKRTHTQTEQFSRAERGVPEGRGERAPALGNDLLHLLGHTYIQEASSMLPAILLDPQPGEALLDLCAAPGSKTTQMAAMMENQGVIVANDVQEKRLWTLRQAMQRCGVVNILTTNRKGEWFGRHMTERFDRVLCDAPCSAQGIVRWDPSALQYSPGKRVEKLAKVQIALLTSAIHAAKIGGRIVYSTCTLTPEENEEVVMEVLELFAGKITLNGCELRALSNEQKTLLNHAQNNSQHVIATFSQNSQLTAHSSQLFRLWPHTANTDGFFCAVLKKTASTCDPISMGSVSRREQSLTKNRERDLLSSIEKTFGTTFIHKDEVLVHLGDTVHLTTTAAASFDLPTPVGSIGLPFAKGLRESAQIRLTHEIATLRGNEAKEHLLDLDDEKLQAMLKNKTVPCDVDLQGEFLLRRNALVIGTGYAKDGVLKGRFPQQFAVQAGM